MIIAVFGSITTYTPNTTLEIGLLIAEESSRGKGIGSECIRLFVNYLFKTKNIMRIQYRIHSFVTSNNANTKTLLIVTG